MQSNTLVIPLFLKTIMLYTYKLIKATYRLVSNKFTLLVK